MNALAGGQLMVSDAVSDYDAARLSLMRRVGPPMVLKPANMASLPPDPEFMTLHAEKGGENWTVAARFSWEARPDRSVALADLGLDSSKRYLAFDFWKSKLLGVVRSSFAFDALPQGACQVVCFRPLVDRPQILGTDRHIGQGVVELTDVHWDGSTLSGKMLLGSGEQWRLFVHVPADWRLDSSSPGKVSMVGQVLAMTLPEANGRMGWSLTFHRK